MIQRMRSIGQDVPPCTRETNEVPLTMPTNEYRFFCSTFLIKLARLLYNWKLFLMQRYDTEQVEVEGDDSSMKGDRQRTCLRHDCSQVPLISIQAQPVVAARILIPNHSTNALQKKKKMLDLHTFTVLLFGPNILLQNDEPDILWQDAQDARSLSSKVERSLLKECGIRKLKLRTHRNGVISRRKLEGHRLRSNCSWLEKDRIFILANSNRKDRNRMLRMNTKPKQEKRKKRKWLIFFFFLFFSFQKVRFSYTFEHNGCFWSVSTCSGCTTVEETTKG